MNFEKPIIKDPTPDQEGDERLAEAQQERVNELAGKMSSSPNEEWHVLSVERSDDKIFVTGPHDLKEDAIVFEERLNATSELVIGRHRAMKR